MTLLTLRKMIMAIIWLLLINQAYIITAKLFNSISGGISTLLVTFVTFYSVRKARSGAINAAWFLVPIILFTLMPLLFNVYKFFFAENQTTLLDRLFEIAPFLVGFVFPLVLLLRVYYGLRDITPGNPNPASERAQRG